MATNYINEGNWQLSIFMLNESEISGDNYVFKENSKNQVFTKRNVTITKNGDYLKVTYLDDAGKTVTKYYNQVFASTNNNVNSQTIILRLAGSYNGQANGTGIVLSTQDSILTPGGAVNINYRTLKSATFTPNDKGTFMVDSANAQKWNPCFLRGTLISTPDGFVCVEELAIGDKILTYTDNNTPVIDTIIWVGNSRNYVYKNKVADESNLPVRIYKNAISDGVPFKDLLITSEHCLFIDGKFIPVRMLVNGSSIIYDPSFTSYDYYHIETKKHSVIMADGMLTESYLDTGNRYSFRRDIPFIYIKNQTSKSWDDHAAAPLAVARHIVEPIYRQIESRAYNLKFHIVTKPPELTNETNIHLKTEKGKIIEPISLTDKKAVFCYLKKQYQSKSFQMPIALVILLEHLSMIVDI